MDSSTIKGIVEIAMAILMLFFAGMIFYNRHQQQKGIGERIIQFLCIGFLIPCIIILGLEGVLKSDVIATLLGGLAGYTLSSMNATDKKSDKAKKEDGFDK